MICAQTLALYRTLFLAYAATGAIASIFMSVAFCRAVFGNPVMVAKLKLKEHAEMRPLLVVFSLSFAAVLATSWPMCIVCWAILRVVARLTMAATHQKH